MNGKAFKPNSLFQVQYAEDKSKRPLVLKDVMTTHISTDGSPIVHVCGGERGGERITIIFCVRCTVTIQHYPVHRPRGLTFTWWGCYCLCF